MMRFGLLLLPLALVLPLLPGCSDEGDPIAPGESDVTGPVSFAEDVQPIFDSRCTGCHGEGGNGGLDLRSPQSYANLVDAGSPNYGAKRVVPGDPDASVLVDKISGGGRYGSRMPPTGSALSAAQISTIRSWIAEGAEPD